MFRWWSCKHYINPHKLAIVCPFIWDILAHAPIDTTKCVVHLSTHMDHTIMQWLQVST